MSAGTSREHPFTSKERRCPIGSLETSTAGSLVVFETIRVERVTQMQKLPGIFGVIVLLRKRTMANMREERQCSSDIGKSCLSILDPFAIAGVLSILSFCLLAHSVLPSSVAGMLLRKSRSDRPPCSCLTTILMLVGSATATPMTIYGDARYVGYLATAQVRGRLSHTTQRWCLAVSCMNRKYWKKCKRVCMALRCARVCIWPHHGHN